MRHLQVATELNNNKDVFKTMFDDVTSEQYLWKPAPEKWCLLEILCHLYDEEREDFRARIKFVLEQHTGAMPAIDPPAWVTERKYMEQDYEAMLAKFLNEREASVNYLHQLQEPDWNKSYNHPKMGALSANLFLHNWLAHDYLHFRQVTATKYAYLKANSTDALDYAGNW